MFPRPLHIAFWFCSPCCTLLQTQEQPRCQATLQDFCLPSRSQECKPPATGHPRSKYSSCPSVIMQTSRWFHNSLSCYFILCQLNSDSDNCRTIFPSCTICHYIQTSKVQVTTSIAGHLGCLGSDLNGQASLQKPRLVTIAEGLADFQACDWLGVPSIWYLALLLYLSWTFIVLKMIIAFPHVKHYKCHITFLYKCS